MTKTTSLLAAAALAVGGLSIAAAPAQAQFTQNDYELRVSGFAQNDVNFDGFILNVSGQLGYFFSDQFEAGLRQDINYSDLGANTLSGGTIVFVNYHFGEDELQPFIGANIGYLYGEAVTDTFVAGPEGGIKYFLDESWFLFGQVEYQFFFEDGGDADEAFDDGVFNYRLGIGVIFGS